MKQPLSEQLTKNMFSSLLYGNSYSRVVGERGLVRRVEGARPQAIPRVDMDEVKESSGLMV